MADVVIRPYRPADHDAVYDICLRTADAGKDATGLYQDPQLVGDVFAGPYLYLEPDFAFVLDNGERAVGYVIGTPDTPRYVKEFRERWLPQVGPNHPEPSHEPTSRDEDAIWLMHHPELMLKPELADHPAHLHIDLLPDCQRGGHGRQLINTILTAFRTAGAAKVHLTMMTANTPARAFYDRLGFYPLALEDAPDGLTCLGRSTEI